MISRETQIPFTLGHWYGEILPEAAYHLEAQAAAVSLAQRDFTLIHRKKVYQGVVMKKELDLKWYKFPNFRTIICGIDCNESLFEDMDIGTPLFEIITKERLPEIFDGRPLRAIAAILTNDGILYRSRGFNLERYYSDMQNYRDRNKLNVTGSKILRLLAKSFGDDPEEAIIPKVTEAEKRRSLSASIL